jgi:hypothetical protein
MSTTAVPDALGEFEFFPAENVTRKLSVVTLLLVVMLGALEPVLEVAVAPSTKSTGMPRANVDIFVLSITPPTQ